MLHLEKRGMISAGNCIHLLAFSNDRQWQVPVRQLIRLWTRKHISWLHQLLLSSQAIPYKNFSCRCDLVGDLVGWYAALHQLGTVQQR